MYDHRQYFQGCGKTTYRDSESIVVKHKLRHSTFEGKHKETLFQPLTTQGGKFYLVRNFFICISHNMYFITSGTGSSLEVIQNHQSR